MAKRSTFNLNGKEVKGKNTLVLEIVKQYVERNPAVTAAGLKKIFNEKTLLRGGQVITLKADAEKDTANIDDYGSNYFLKDAIRLANGEEVVVWCYWPDRFFKPFIEMAKEDLGYKIEEVESKKEVGGDNDVSKGGRKVRVEITVPRGLKTIELLRLDDETMGILEDNDMDAAEAWEDVRTKEWEKDAGQLMEFVFDNSYNNYDITVFENDTDEELYEGSIEGEPSYTPMSLSSAEDNYGDDEDELDDYKEFLDIEMEQSPLNIAKGIEAAFKGLKANSVDEDSFIPTAMSKALEFSKARKALLKGVEESEETTITFYINLKDGQKFDIGKLSFIGVDTGHDDYSYILSDNLSEEIILLNTIIYGGKMYFAGHDQIDFSSDMYDCEDYDYVDKNIYTIDEY